MNALCMLPSLIGFQVEEVHVVALRKILDSPLGGDPGDDDEAARVIPKLHPDAFTEFTDVSNFPPYIERHPAAGLLVVPQPGGFCQISAARRAKAATTALGARGSEANSLYQRSLGQLGKSLLQQLTNARARTRVPRYVDRFILPYHRLDSQLRNGLDGERVQTHLEAAPFDKIACSIVDGSRFVLDDTEAIATLLMAA